MTAFFLRARLSPALRAAEAACGKGLPPLGGGIPLSPRWFAARGWATDHHKAAGKGLVSPQPLPHRGDATGGRMNSGWRQPRRPCRVGISGRTKQRSEEAKTDLSDGVCQGFEGWEDGGGFGRSHRAKEASFAAVRAGAGVSFQERWPCAATVGRRGFGRLKVRRRRSIANPRSTRRRRAVVCRVWLTKPADGSPKKKKSNHYNPAYLKFRYRGTVALQSRSHHIQ